MSSPKPRDAARAVLLYTLVASGCSAPQAAMDAQSFDAVVDRPAASSDVVSDAGDEGTGSDVTGDVASDVPSDVPTDEPPLGDPLSWRPAARGPFNTGYHRHVPAVNHQP